MNPASSRINPIESKTKPNDFQSLPIHFEQQFQPKLIGTQVSPVSTRFSIRINPKFIQMNESKTNRNSNCNSNESDPHSERFFNPFQSFSTLNSSNSNPTESDTKPSESATNLDKLSFLFNPTSNLNEFDSFRTTFSPFQSVSNKNFNPN